MNSEIQELLATCENAGAAASALLRWTREDPERLAIAAEAWLEARTRLPRGESQYEDGRAIARLLTSLADASTEYRELLARLDRHAGPASADLEVVILLAPARATPAQWLQPLLAWVEAGNGHPSTVLYSFGERMPALAYALLSAMESRDRWADAASTAALALAVSRIGLQPSFKNEAALVASLTAERLLDDDQIFWFAMMSVRAKRPGPPALDEALALAFTGRGEDRQTRLVRGLQILSAQGKREELIEVLCNRIKSEPSMIPELVKATSDAGIRLFLGWGQDAPTQLLGRLGRAFLDAGAWPSRFWVHTLRERLLHDAESTVKRELTILAETLFQIADDPNVPLSQRQRSLEALGRTGLGRMAMRLGKLRAHAELADEVKRVRAQLARAKKGHDVDPSNGLQLALNHLLKKRSQPT